MLKQIFISFAFPMFALAQAPYASERPMAEPTIFGKGIVSGGDFDSHPAFTPDGRTIYFVRSAPNFSFWTIFVSRFENGHWTPPEVAPFSGQYSDADPLITADGKQFYFLSKRPVNGRAKNDNDIWVMNKTETGWSEPRHLDAPVNSDGDEWYPTLTRDGTIYFGSDRAGGHGKTDLYRARLVDGKYATAENLGEPVSTAADEYEPFIAPDESFLIFMAAGRSDSLGRGDLYLSYRRGEKWSEPQNLGKKINSNGTEYSPKISPDGKYFFWSSTRGLRTRQWKSDWIRPRCWKSSGARGMDWATFIRSISPNCVSKARSTSDILPPGGTAAATTISLPDRVAAQLCRTPR